MRPKAPHGDDYIFIGCIVAVGGDWQEINLHDHERGLDRCKP